MPLFRRKPLFRRTSGRLTMLSRHDTLDQLARDMLDGLPRDFQPRRRVCVIVGTHSDFRYLPLWPGFRVGIQTEQFLDADGTPLWGQHKRKMARNLLATLRRLDVMLDINPANEPWYDAAGLPARERAKLRFGPAIFPSEPRLRVPGQGDLFFGNVNDRRRTVLDGLAHRAVEVVPAGVYGDALAARLRAADTVLNIHFAEGTYTEAPRLLTAYLAGKPVLSELLAPPFVAGEHYLPLTDTGTLDLDQVHAAFTALVTQHWSFAGFLRDIDA